MDVLNSVFTKVAEFGLLQALAGGNIRQQISLYADDVALFIRPTQEEMSLTTNILEAFGEASGLRTNFQKSCAIPIRCEHSEVAEITASMSSSLALIWDYQFLIRS